MSIRTKTENQLSQRLPLGTLPTSICSSTTVSKFKRALQTRFIYDRFQPYVSEVLLHTVGLFLFRIYRQLPMTYFVLRDRCRVLPMQLLVLQCHFQPHIQQLYHHLLLPWQAQCVIPTHAAYWRLNTDCVHWQLVFHRGASRHREQGYQMPCRRNSQRHCQQRADLVVQPWSLEHLKYITKITIRLHQNKTNAWTKCVENFQSRWFCS